MECERSAAKRVLSLLLLLFAVILTFRTSWIISETLLDSDAAANMILGEKLAREGGILSSTFRYGTELYVADMQIICGIRSSNSWNLNGRLSYADGIRNPYSTSAVFLARSPRYIAPIWGIVT